MTLQIQFLTLAMMLGSGILLGTVYDACRVAAADFRLPRWTFPLIDATYWAAATVFVFQLLRYSNGAEVRLFVFLGLAAGAIAYYALLSKLVMKVIHQCIAFLKRLFRFAVWLVHLLIVKPLMLLYRVLLTIFGMLAALTVLLAKVMLQLLYPFRRLWGWMIKRKSFHKLYSLFHRFWKWIKYKYNRGNKEE